jgi:hypothetical protein
MKYVYLILILMAGILAMVLVVALIFIGWGDFSQNNGENLPQTMTTTIPPRSTPPPRPTIKPTPIKSAQDPIVGPWLNGMVFYANGTVGSDGKTSWKVNENENNSYFIISDMSSEGAKNSGSVISTEWVYTPTSDKINRRGSSESFSRGIPKPVPTPIRTVTTIQIQPTPVISTTTTIAKKFSYSDCVDVCKLNYWADHHIGYYNDCLNTCNIENLNSQS